MIRVDIETIIMAAGPVPSVIVLRERNESVGAGAPPRALHSNRIIRGGGHQPWN